MKKDKSPDEIPDLSKEDYAPLRNLIDATYRDLKAEGYRRNSASRKERIEIRKENMFRAGVLLGMYKEDEE